MFFGRAKKRALRVYFATDVHGSDRCFRKFLAAADSYDADVLVLGGDIAGKGLVPIRSHNGTLSAKVRGEPVTVPRAEEDRLRAEINRLGFYSIKLFICWRSARLGAMVFTKRFLPLGEQQALRGCVEVNQLLCCGKSVFVHSCTYSAYHPNSGSGSRIRDSCQGVHGCDCECDPRRILGFPAV